MAITIKCGQTIHLVAEDIAGTADVQFPKPGTPGGLTQAAAETKAKSDAEKKAQENAEADITRQQNEINCAGGDKCKKTAPKPTSTVVAGSTSASSILNNDRSGTAKGKSKADGKGDVECKHAG